MATTSYRRPAKTTCRKDSPFRTSTYIVATREGAFGRVAGCAYMIGSWTACARYILQHGMRSYAEIVEV